MFKKVLYWLIRLIYLGLIVFSSYIVLGFLTVSRNEKFMQDNEDRFFSDPSYFISTVAVTGYNDNVRSFNEKEPLYSNYHQSNMQENIIEIYSFVFYNEDRISNGLFFFFTNLSIPKEEPQSFTIDLYFASILIKTKSNKMQFSFKVMYENTSAIYILEEETKDSSGNYANITGLEIKSDVGTSIMALNSYENLNLTHEKYDLIKKYNISSFDNLEDNTSLYYNSGIIDELNSYNYIIVLYFILYLLVILAITYFLFIHSPLLRHIRSKKHKQLSKEIDEQNTSYNKDIDIQRKDI
jgi:hypothetical protein